MAGPMGPLIGGHRTVGSPGRHASGQADFDPMYGPAVRRKRFHRSGGFAVSHQCIRPLIGACCAPGHHGYQRACVLISRQASNGPFGSPGFACARKTGPPSRFILSQTSAGKRGLCHRSLLINVQFLCSCCEAVPSSRPAHRAGHRAQRPSRLAVAPGSPRRGRLQATP